MANRTYIVAWGHLGEGELQTRKFKETGDVSFIGAARSAFVEKVSQFETFVSLTIVDHSDNDAETVVGVYDITSLCVVSR